MEVLDKGVALTTVEGEYLTPYSDDRDMVVREEVNFEGYLDLSVLRKPCRAFVGFPYSPVSFLRPRGY